MPFNLRRTQKTEPPSTTEMLERFCGQIETDRQMIAELLIFDCSFYETQLSDRGVTADDSITHYLLHGASMGLDPHPLFSTEFYLQNNPDVRAAGENPLVHFLRQGGLEQRDPGPLFDCSWYFQENPDIIESRINPLVHYLQYGWKEGRETIWWFNRTDYLIENLEVAKSGMDAMIHYALHARKNDLTLSPDDPDVENQTQATCPAAPGPGNAHRAPVRMAFPPGHFYSPVVDTAGISRFFDRDEVKKPPRTLPDVDLRESEQLALLARLEPFGKDIFFPEMQERGLRYFYKNEFFSHVDANILYGMMRLFQPKQIIEVGSGFSSAAMLDVNERVFGSSIKFTFVEPYPDRLLSLLTEEDLQNTQIVSDDVQTCDPESFSRLNEDDFLFIDSSHVCKTGSDLQFLLFDVLPRLNPGVIVHFHDIFYPFEYPRDWVQEGRSWNEAYLLRAFLAGNCNYAILAWNSFLGCFNKDALLKYSERCTDSFGSIWLRKLA